MGLGFGDSRPNFINPMDFFGVSRVREVLLVDASDQDSD